MPKVSVIMPVYNTAPYLEESINSILHQTLNDLELLIVDDGSTDGSDAIIKKFINQDSRIRYRYQENMGQSLARNVALEMASGDYIYFMDSDDVLEEDSLQILCSHCDEMDYNILFFDGDVLYDDNTTRIGQDYHRTSSFLEEYIYKGTDVIRLMLDNYAFKAVPWLYLVKKKCIDCLSLSFFPGIIHEDELFTFLLFVQSERIGCIKKSLVKHRIRVNSTMSIKFSMRNINCYMTVFDNLVAFSKSKNYYKYYVDKYIKYTINGVCQTSVKLMLKDRIKFLDICRKSNLLKYISKKNIFLLLLK